MQTTEIDLETVRAAADMIPEDQPFTMLNLLRYREQADYGERMDMAPCSGREAYFQRYVPAFGQLTQGEGIQLFWAGGVLARVVGPAEERWDVVALVEYPSFTAFQRLVENPRYQAEAALHRLAALADWRLIVTAKMP